MTFTRGINETERLIIRPLEQRDYDVFVAGYKNCLPAKNRFDETLPDLDFVTEAWFGQMLAKQRREAETDYAYKFNIFRKQDGLSIGYCGIAPHYREDFQYGRIGYSLHNTFWGQGYATECVRTLIAVGFEQLHLHRLEAHVNLDNPASKHVLQKAGFAFECIRKAFILEDGVWTDNEIYYINNESWTPASKQA